MPFNSPSLAHLHPLIICRGPVRLEAVEIFAQHGVLRQGILLSHSDAFGGEQALVADVRCLPPGVAVHLVKDYMPLALPGQSALQAKQEFAQQLYALAQQYGYTSIFAGYGFMAEDAEFVAAIQALGLTWIGPSARVIQQAGAKDAAKALAQRVKAQVVPGVAFAPEAASSAEQRLDAAVAMVQAFQAQHATDTLRLKAVLAGGGKGQRLVSPKADRAAIRQLVQAIWGEIKAAQDVRAQALVIELNLPAIRHWEVQLIGNGVWCLALGGRDCSLQRHEQKLIEMSLTEDTLSPQDAKVFRHLLTDAEAFGAALGLDSVSTYEAMIDANAPRHYFMEVNTRLQVEHGVTELIYGLKFSTPTGDVEVQQLIHLMGLIALYGKALPKPQVFHKSKYSIEVRLNAMDKALNPAAGALITGWSQPIAEEIRFDQGLSRHLPGRCYAPSYRVIGQYDANLALILTHADTLPQLWQRIAACLNELTIYGRQVATNQTALLAQLMLLATQTDESYWPLVSTQWIADYLRLAAFVSWYLKAAPKPWLHVLDPHLVIASNLAGHLGYRVTLQANGRSLTSVEEREVFSWMASLQLPQLKLVAGRIAFSPAFEEKFAELEEQQGATWVETLLEPRQVLHGNQVLSPSGGTFYCRESPDKAPCVSLGQDVQTGQLLGVIEVMKMFNPVYAPRSGRIADICVQDAASITKGQVLFEFSS